MKINKKAVFWNHYESRLTLIFATIILILGIAITLSTQDIIPRFALTQDMLRMTGLMIGIAAVLLTLFLFFAVNSFSNKLNDRIASGKIVPAEVTQFQMSRNWCRVHYTYIYAGETHEGVINLSRSLKWRKIFAAGETFDIIVSQTESGNLKPVLKMFTNEQVM